MGYSVNHIVDCVGNGELCLGIVVKDQGERIQVQGPTKQVSKVSLKQVVADYGRCPTNHPLPTLTALQNDINAIQAEIDTTFFWETLVESAPESRPLSTQAEEYFGASPGARQCSALGRALMAAPLRFRYDGTGFSPNSPEEIARLEELRRQRAEKASLRERTRQWLTQAIGAEEAACLREALPVPEELESFLSQCTDYLLRGQNSPAVNLLATAGSRLSPRELALSLLRKTHRMPKDADEFLLANGIHAGFSPDVLAAAEALQEIAREPPIVIVDFHGEATSEKQAMGFYLDGRVTAVLGTHTHVPTADSRILPGGTAFQCDVGMVGSQESVLGRDAAAVIENFRTGMPMRFSVAEGHTVVMGAVVTLDEETGRATEIQRVFRPWPPASLG